MPHYFDIIIKPEENVLTPLAISNRLDGGFRQDYLRLS